MVASDFTGSGRQLNIPRTVNTIERAALQGVLGSFAAYRVILVTAPTGYGKTTSIAQFVERARIPAAWHTIEERDRDLANLQQHTLRALTAIAPTISDTVEGPVSPRDAATHIANTVRDHVNFDFVLVLDDLHLLAGAQNTETWLQHLVEQMPPKCHLVFVSRTVPDLPLAELIARRTIIAIGPSQLRFTDEEAAYFARQTGSTLTDDQVRQRVRQLEGWPAGVVMSLQPLPNEIEANLLKGQQGPEAVFYELASAMLERQSPVLRDFLLSSSVLQRLTPDLCTRILRIPDSLNILRQTLNRGLYITQVAGGMVYHRLFRGFLQTQLKQRSPDLFVDLHGRAGDWYLEQGDIETAFDHFIEAHLIDRALSIVDHAHMAYFSQGKVETLLMWRARLGDHAERLPYLLYKCSIIYTERYMYAESEAELEAARRAFERLGDRVGLADVELQHIMILRRRGESLKIVDKCRALLAVPDLPDRIIARTQQFLALAHLALGDPAQAAALLESIVPIYQANQDLYALSTVLQDLEVAYTRLGDLDSASHCLQQVVSIRRQLGRPDALALALNNLGFHYHQRQNYRDAIRTLEEGLQLVSQTSNRRAESYLLWSMADIRRDLGEFEAAQQLYTRAYELSSGMEASLKRDITLSMATLYRWQGNYPLSERLAREVADAAGATPDDLTAAARLWAARAHQGQADAAHRALTALLRRMDDQRAGSEYRLAALFAALTALLAGQAEAVDGYLRDSLTTQAEEQRHIATEFIAEIAHEPVLRGYIAAQPHFRIILSAVEKLNIAANIRQARISPQQAASIDQTYSVQVNTLGGESILRNGIAVPSSAWRASRAREFFLYLILEGPQTRDAISLAFWPDSSIKAVRSNFHTTLYRARQALGDNVVMFEDDRYRINPEIELTCDALIVEENVRQARVLRPVDPVAEDLFRRAIELYRGDLLPSMDAPWIDLHRERLFELFMEALHGAGQCARARQGQREAITLFLRALEHDPYRENIHRALLATYAEFGETVQVVRHFRKMQDLFQRDLGISPSPETLALVKSLT
jgi:ATP/maltotriose-dependent transcriptional regulator MalT/DNA-binding SARP family transcriptional activator